MKIEIKSNLENLLNKNLKILEKCSIEKMFDELINENPKAFNLNLGIMTNLFDNDEIKSFKKAKKNSELISAFEKAKKMEFNKEEVIDKLKADILNSISKAKQFIDSENKEFKNQIIFLEYDFEPIAYLCGFGIGDYPILEKPEYFKVNFREELYNGIGSVDYSKIWKDLIGFNELLEDLNIDDEVIETELYQCLLNSIKYKTYLFLFKTFDQIGIKAFDGIEIEKPLMIYGNEHDCESINIYTFE